MGGPDSPQSGQLSPEERLRILEQEKQAFFDEWTKAGSRVSELEEELRALNSLLNYRKSVQEFMDRRGKELDCLLKQHKQQDSGAVIRSDELRLIVRYNPDVAPDVELIEKFRVQGRSIDWWANMIGDALLALDKAESAGGQNMGGTLYTAIVRCQPKLSVIDIEAVVRYAFHAIPVDPAPEGQSAAVWNDLVSNVARGEYALDQDHGVLAKARDAYRRELQSHRDYYRALDPTAKTLLQLRDTLYNRTWAAALKDLDRIEEMQRSLAKREHVSILGMPEMDIQTLRASIQAMREYERKHNIDLDWFSKLPKDLDVFSSER